MDRGAGEVGAQQGGDVVSAFKPSEWNPKPQTLEDYTGNVRFQLDNVEGWLLALADGHDSFTSAHVKAECLVDAASALLAKFEAEARRRKGVTL